MPCGVILNWSRRTRMFNMNSLQSASMIQAVPSKRRKSESSYGDGSGCKFVNRGFLTPPSRTFCHMAFDRFHGIHGIERPGSD